MYQHLDCICLRIVKVSDKRDLMSAWTRQCGRLSFSIPSGASRQARMRRALLSPLSTFEAECELRPDRDIHSLRDIHPGESSLAILSSPAKNLIAIFLSEFLDLLLRRSEPDSALSDFLFSSVNTLATDSTNKLCGIFHIIFLYRLTHYIGVEPDNDAYTEGAVFDLREGIFRNTPPLHPDFLSGDLCRLFAGLATADYDNPPHTTRQQRADLLDALLKYYSIHLMSFSSLKSLDILRDMA
ncbi:MAG: DNA repair protein RecO C-terminal domain-containing protein [Muribaculaceae bacterium]|nr:DNA repair protein RecO C-terminal domain-containing protein [Muribaculaceae bacterium]